VKLCHAVVQSDLKPSSMGSCVYWKDGHTAYDIIGATFCSYNGRYVQTARFCNNRPVYQKDGSDGFALFQPSGTSYWNLGNSDDATSCDNHAHLSSSLAHCGERPDGAGCAGGWQEFDESIGWRDNPRIIVIASH
jgi:hypothetical protein